eukprot:479032-Prymnesium_polylepis.1
MPTLRLKVNVRQLREDNYLDRGDGEGVMWFGSVLQYMAATRAQYHIDRLQAFLDRLHIRDMPQPYEEIVSIIATTTRE